MYQLLIQVLGILQSTKRSPILINLHRCSERQRKQVSIKVKVMNAREKNNVRLAGREVERWWCGRGGGAGRKGPSTALVE